MLFLRFAPTSTFRSFSTSSICRSNIGKQAILYPPTVSFQSTPRPDGNIDLQVTGPKGSKTVQIEPFFTLNHENVPTTSSSATPAPLNSLSLTVEDSSKKIQRSRWGLRRTLVANAVKGLTEGFVVPIKLVGVGYRAQVEEDPATKGKRLNMKLGFAHPVYVSVPSDITADAPLPTRIVLRGTDKQALGQFAANIRNWRKPEPYKGKGIFVGSETIKLKAVKKK